MITFFRDYFNICSRPQNGFIKPFYHTGHHFKYYFNNRARKE